MLHVDKDEGLDVIRRQSTLLSNDVLAKFDEPRGEAWRVGLRIRHLRNG